MTRRTLRLIFELELVALFAGGALVTAQDKPEPTFAEIVKMPVVYSVPGMHQVTVRSALVYRTVEGRGLEMDVYAPPDLGPKDRRPAILFVHGGPVGAGMKPKGMGLFKSYGALTAAKGFIGVTFDHRFYEPGLAPEADQDVAALVAHVRAQAADLHVDEERLALWAFSGGGPFLSRPLRERQGYLRAVVAYYPVLDLRQLPPGAKEEPSLEERTRLSPAAQVGPGARPHPPILVARAGQDDAWLNSTVDAFLRESLQGGAPLELLNHPQGRHGFDILDDDARSREIIARTFDFLKTHLR